VSRRRPATPRLARVAQEALPPADYRLLAEYAFDRRYPALADVYEAVAAARATVAAETIRTPSGSATTLFPPVPREVVRHACRWCLEPVASLPGLYCPPCGEARREQDHAVSVAAELLEPLVRYERAVADGPCASCGQLIRASAPRAVDPRDPRVQFHSRRTCTPNARRRVACDLGSRPMDDFRDY
jgi:hypothetical protein